MLKENLDFNDKNSSNDASLFFQALFKKLVPNRQWVKNVILRLRLQFLELQFVYILSFRYERFKKNQLLNALSWIL